MKSFISYCIIAIMACGSVFPVAAQRKAHGFEKKRAFDDVHAEQTVTTAFGKVNAISDGSTGVIVKWQMTSERGSFAFDVFRFDDDGKHFVGGQSIGGSGLTSGNEPVFGQEVVHHHPGVPEESYGLLRMAPACGVGQADGAHVHAPAAGLGHALCTLRACLPPNGSDSRPPLARSMLPLRVRPTHSPSIDGFARGGKN